MRQVATLDTLEAGKPRTVELDGTKILLFRDGDGVRAFSGACPHAGAPLDQGAVCEGRLVCPWHKAVFGLADGALLEPPALQPLRRYPVRVEGDAVLVSAEPMATPFHDPAPQGAGLDARVMVVVGAGAAGAAGASALREFGFHGRLVLVGHEPGEPFDRTALSKFVLEGGMKPAETAPLWPDGFADRHRIERLHDTVTGIDPAARTLSLASGGNLPYDAVLLAPGSVPRPLDVPGGDAPMVYPLRTRADASAILAGLSGQPRVVIVGGSFIGLEAASALRKRGIAVAVVSPSEIPFEPVLGREIGALLREMHESNGVAFHGGTRVAAIEDGHVRLETGERLSADLVLAGVGVRPATGFASALGLAEDGGLEADAGLRVTDGVFVAGDSARFPFGDGRIRVEHWRVAQQHARVAARNMLGGDARFEQPPFFWTYHYGKRFEVHGYPSGFDRTEIEGDLSAAEFIARQYRGDELVGLVGCGRDTEMAGLALALPARP